MRVIVVIFNDNEKEFYKELVSFLKNSVNDSFEEIYVSKVIKTTSFEINRMERTVRDSNHQLIYLTSKEFDLLYLLVDHKNHVFTKQQLYKLVWDYIDIPDPRHMPSFIRRLRKKIEENPSKPKHIITVWGIGYKFIDNE